VPASESLAVGLSAAIFFPFQGLTKKKDFRCYPSHNTKLDPLKLNHLLSHHLASRPVISHFLDFHGELNGYTVMSLLSSYEDTTLSLTILHLTL
jgi:hypothetical protein